MFNPDFYPTPANVIDEMLIGHALNGKNVLEPSAGKGNIVDVLIQRGANVSCCETQKEFKPILESKCDFIQDDFLKLTPEQCSHFNFIIANPPFSDVGKHILKMWEVAPDGCTILTLANNEFIRNTYTRERREVLNLISSYGVSKYLGSAFKVSERKTDVEIVLIKLFKPVSDREDFSDYFSLDEETDTGATEGVIPYNAVREIVQRVTGAMKLYEEQLNVGEKMVDLIGAFSGVDKITFVCKSNEKTYNRETFRSAIQKKAWEWVFRKMQMEKYMTNGVRKDINAFVEEQKNIPFTMKNIYLMMDMIVQTYPNQIDKSIKEVFDNITKHHHENRYHLEGWKTNSHYLVNQKFIFPGLFEVSYGGRFLARLTGYNTSIVDDLNRVLCYLNGVKYEDIPSLYSHTNEGIEPGKWFDWGFFEVKGFKKGTGHFKFKDRDVWANFNREIGRVYGYALPEKI